LPGRERKNELRDAAKPPVDVTRIRARWETLITFGSCDFWIWGYLTADKELELMCPMNKIGV